MARLKPMRVNSNQIARLLRQPIGSGFIAYRYSDETVEVMEFALSESGDLLKTDGTPLEYYCKNGKVVRYHVVVQEEVALT